HKGIHAKGYDDQSIGICYEGGLDEEGKPCDTRTCWQKHSLKVLIKALLMDYPDCRIVGHRDIMEDVAELQDEYCLRECPCFEVSEEF
ncbi:MAG: N-acetylmuramoyl-L-alanine amidase, partial [Bacteroides sp.]|nr:N-acetylmuramoyl-L-alanine amidase [Bacteroides sp.]